MRPLEDSRPVPSELLWSVRNWESGRIHRNPAMLAVEVLSDCGRPAYDALLAELFTIFGKRFALQPEEHRHFLVRPRWVIVPCPAIRPGADTLQSDGSAVIHPLPA